MHALGQTDLDDVDTQWVKDMAAAAVSASVVNAQFCRHFRNYQNLGKNVTLLWLICAFIGYLPERRGTSFLVTCFVKLVEETKVKTENLNVSKKAYLTY